MKKEIRFTRKDLIEQGYLVDVTDFAERMGITVPVAVTFTLWQDYISPPERSISTSENIVNTLHALRTNILAGQTENIVEFDMMYPVDHGVTKANIIAKLAPDNDGIYGGTLYLKSDVE